ncbi:MAG: ATP-binding protein [Ignavibacteriaceae bacterium]
MKKLSLRNRISFYYLGATAVLVLILFFTIYYVVHKTVYSHLDGDLKAESSEVFKSIVVLNDKFIFANPFEWTEKEHSQVEVNPTFIQVCDTNGFVIKKTGNLLDSRLEFFPAEKTKIFFDAELSNQPTRQLQMPIQNPHGKILGYLIIAIPLEESAIVLNNLRIVLLFAYPVVLIVLFFITRFFAGKSIQPVNSVISTAERITKENLEERIELPLHKDELYKLTSTINQLLDRLEDAVMREKQFTSDASHELRTPLAVIKGTLEVLIRKPREVEHYESKISYCITEVNRMSNIIDQLLMLARYDSGKISPNIQKINLKDEVLSVINRLQNQSESKNISVGIINNDNNITVNADPDMTGIILENIISNSIKYSNPDSDIEIKIEKNKTTAICSVKDHGIGMTEEQAERIFDRFYRADESRNSKVSGNGLGLAIVKRLSDIQNLKLEVKSRPKSGTTVIIYFPQS